MGGSNRFISKIVGKGRDLTIQVTLGLFLGTLILYIFTLHPFFPLGDSGEFIIVAKEGGVAHPPGFALYTLIANLLASVNIGNLVTRLNALSAIFGALSVTALFLLVYKVTKNYLASLTASLLLAISHLFWLFSIFTEVYTLSIFLNILSILLFIIWIGERKPKTLYLLSFVGGLSISVHYINLFTLILIALFSLTFIKRDFFKLRNIFLFAGSFLLGLTPILSVPFAAANNAFINWGNIKNLSSFVKFINRSDYGSVGLGESFNPILVSLREQIPFLFKAIYNSFGIIIILVLPAFWVKIKKAKLPLFFLANFIVLGPILVLFLNYPLTSPYPDVALNHKRLMQQFHILSFPYVALLIGLGVNKMLSRLKKSKNSAWYWIIIISIFSALIFQLFGNYQKVASARNFIYKTYGENIFANIDGPTILITGTEESNVLNYLYAVEGKKKDNVRLMTFSLMQHKWYVDQLKVRYPDVNFPFDNVIVGEKFDDFYEENLKNFSIVFAPLDDQASQSVSGKFSFVSYGVIVELVEKDNEPDLNTFVNRNKQIFDQLVGKQDFIGDKYYDEATKEVLMAYARAFTNIALKSKNFGNKEAALNFLDIAKKTIPEYYKANEVAASIYLDNDDLSGALNEYKDILDVNPSHKLSLRNVALIYDTLGNYALAREYAVLYQKVANTQAEKQEAQQILLQIGN